MAKIDWEEARERALALGALALMGSAGSGALSLIMPLAPMAAYPAMVFGLLTGSYAVGSVAKRKGIGWLEKVGEAMPIIGVGMVPVGLHLVSAPVSAAWAGAGMIGALEAVRIGIAEGKKANRKRAEKKAIEALEKERKAHERAHGKETVLDMEMLDAGIRNDEQGLKKKLRDGANPNARFEKFGGMGLLHLGPKTRAGEGIAKILLEAGADPKGHGWETGETPLMAASIAGDDRWVRLLLEAGADPSEKTMEESSSLEMAIQSGSGECARLLISAGADPNELTGIMKTPPLALAVSLRHRNCVVSLLEAGADWKKKDIWGKSALDMAHVNRGEDAAEELLAWVKAKEEKALLEGVGKGSFRKIAERAAARFRGEQKAREETPPPKRKPRGL